MKLKKKNDYLQEKSLSLNKLQDQIKQFDLQKSANSNYEVEVDDPKVHQITTDPGQFVTNCLVCNRTCHERCYIVPPASKDGCSAMKDGYCTMCPAKCHHSKHTNAGFYFVVKTEKKKVKRDELYK